MQKSFFIIIGRSGCGKGTQAELLKTYLEERGYDSVMHITTGGGFREMMKREEHLPKMTKEIYDDGGLMPEFLAVWNWSDIFINKLEKNSTVILDGAPRKLDEVYLLDGAIDYLGYLNPVVIYLDVSEEWSKDRLLGRGREDDTEESVMKRLGWFTTEVMPVLETYKDNSKFNSKYKFITVNGEGTIEEVHKNLVVQLD